MKVYYVVQQHGGENGPRVDVAKFFELRHAELHGARLGHNEHMNQSGTVIEEREESADEQHAAHANVASAGPRPASIDADAVVPGVTEDPVTEDPEITVTLDDP